MFCVFNLRREHPKKIYGDGDVLRQISHGKKRPIESSIPLLDVRLVSDLLSVIYWRFSKSDRSVIKPSRSIQILDRPKRFLPK